MARLNPIDYFLCYSQNSHVSHESQALVSSQDIN